MLQYFKTALGHKLGVATYPEKIMPYTFEHRCGFYSVDSYTVICLVYYAF